MQIAAWGTFLLYAGPSSAMSVCLYARSNSSPISGHSFVALEDRGKIVETYGMWPEQKVHGMVSINNLSDLPITILVAKYGSKLNKDFKTLSEDHICREIPGLQKEAVRMTVQGYLQQYGPYHQFSNNCTHFAVRIYDAATGERFPVVQTPLRVRQIIVHETRR